MDLTAYNFIVINTSAGKDSQAMMDLVYRMANIQGVTDRLVAVHADLGEAEWDGTEELAREQADHYGIRFIVTRREQDNLLDYVERRGAWPDSTTRYCTSEYKRGPCNRVLTQLSSEWKEATGWKPKDGTPGCKVLNCLGFRAQESVARAKRQPLSENGRASTKGELRKVSDWLPLHTWSETEVWDCIKASGVRHHWAYDRGMSRLSCRFCVFAPKHMIQRAAMQPENAEVFEKYLAMEEKTGHTFTMKYSLADVKADIAAGVELPEGNDASWNM